MCSCLLSFPEEMAEDDEERETSLDLNSRGISAQEMSPPQLIQYETQTVGYREGSHIS